MNQINLYKVTWLSIVLISVSVLSMEYSSQFMSNIELLDRISMSNDADVIDVGCGTGTFSARLAGMVPGGSVLGIDISKECIELAQKKYGLIKNLFFMNESAQELNHDNHFDIAVFTGVLHYISAEEKPEVLKKIYRTLRPEGKLLLRAPARALEAPHQAAIIETVQKPEWLMKLAGSEDPGVMGLITEKMFQVLGNAPTLEELQLLIENAGFEGEITIYNHAHPTKSKDALMHYFKSPFFGDPSFARMSEAEQIALITEITDLYIKKMKMGADCFEYRIPLVTAIVTKVTKPE